MKRLTMYYGDCEEAYLSCERCGKAGISECWTQEDCTQTVVDRLAEIEDILGDDYDIDRLLELARADREGRCVVLPAGGYSNKDGERALKNAMFVVGLTNNGMNRYIADAIAEKLTRDEAEAALKETED